MKAILTVHNIASDLVTTFWTPIFVGIFIAILAYALWTFYIIRIYGGPWGDR